MSTLKLSSVGRRYGYLKDTLDSRDRIHPSSFRTSAAAPLPPSWDLLGCLGKPRDQGELGACTAFAGCGMREFLFRTYNVWEKGTIEVNADTIMLSPLFLYYKERELEGTLGQDSGAQMRSIPYVLNHVGTCQEIEDGYDPSQYNNAPTEQQVQEAQLFRAGAYHRILGGVPVMKSVIASGYAFVWGFDVYESFESNWPTNTMPIPDTNHEQLLGGHAVLIFGYDDADQTFSVRNSWGRDWGVNGNFKFPYAAVDKLVTDAWTQHLGPAWR